MRTQPHFGRDHSAAQFPFGVLRLFAATISTAAILCSIAPRHVKAAGGALDSAFGPGGKVTTHFNGNDLANAVALQPDGKIVVVGTSFGVTPPDFVVARYNPDGRLDTSFDGDGRVTTDILGFPDSAETIALQPDGKIIVGGQATTSFQSGGRFALVRYNSNGSLDTTFGTGGKVTAVFTGNEAGARDIVIQPDGKIVAVGTAQSPTGGGVALARYNADGSLELGCGCNGPGCCID